MALRDCASHRTDSSIAQVRGSGRQLYCRSACLYEVGHLILPIIDCADTGSSSFGTDTSAYKARSSCTVMVESSARGHTWLLVRRLLRNAVAGAFPRPPLGVGDDLCKILLSKHAASHQISCFHELGVCCSPERRCCAASKRPERRGYPRATSISAGSSAILKKVLRFMGPGIRQRCQDFAMPLTEATSRGVRSRLSLTELPGREELRPTPLGNRGGNAADLRGADC